MSTYLFWNLIISSSVTFCVEIWDNWPFTSFKKLLIQMIYITFVSVFLGWLFFILYVLTFIKFLRETL
jgi:hypothetical protein